MLACLILATVAAPPNVVFLSVDTLRADHLGCYGYENETSPNIDKLAEECLVFEDCVCEVPLTFPSFGSMLTSRYPRITGATRNGLHMPDEITSIVQLFQDAGYYTFCVQSNWTLKAKLSGLDRGFDVYEDDFHKGRWFFIKAERHANEVTEVALEQLDRIDPDKPFFCWIHYTDPHAPYRFHRKFKPSGKPRFWQANRKKVLAKYDSEVAFTDHHLARLLEAIPTENTYLLFVADHGESLYEHDYLGHGRRIYQTGLHVPLMITGPGIEPGRTGVPVRGVDIGPTLLGLAGLSAKPGMLGVDILQKEIKPSRIRVIETYGGAVPKIPGAKVLMADKPPQYQGVLLEGWKLILDENKRAELYHIETDPIEERDLADKERGRVEKLQELIKEWTDRFPHAAKLESSLTKEDRRALESLGYLE